MSNQPYFTLAKLIAEDGRRFGITLEWDWNCVKDARRGIAVPPSMDSVMKAVEVPPGVVSECAQMLTMLRDLGYIVVESSDE